MVRAIERHGNFAAVTLQRDFVLVVARSRNRAWSVFWVRVPPCADVYDVMTISIVVLQVMVGVVQDLHNVDGHDENLMRNESTR